MPSIPSGALIKANLKSYGTSSLFGAAFGVQDYNSRRADGESVGSAAFNSLFWNVMPAVVFHSVGAQMAFGLIPAIPAVMQGINMGLRYTANKTRQSAMPFSGYSYVPTMMAVQTMQNGYNSMSRHKNLTATHTALALQAYRRSY